MKHDTKKITDELGQLYDEMSAIADRGVKESGEWGLDNETKFDELSAKHTKLESELKRLETLNEKKSIEVDKVEEKALTAGKSVDEFEDHKAKRNQATKIWLSRGIDALTDEQRSILNTPIVNPDGSTRAQTVTTTGGGYTVPTDMANEIITSMLWYGGMREASTILSTAGGNDLDYPTCDDTSNTGALIGINTKASEDDLVFGTKQLNAYKFSSNSIRVPNELIQDSAFNIEQYVTSQLATRLGRATNTYYTTGTGSSQPEGITIGTSQGALSAAATTVAAADFINLKHSIDKSYRMAKCHFMFNDTTLAAFKKVALASANQSLWQPGIVGGAPSTIDGDEYIINNDLADMAGNSRSILYGDFKKNIIRDVLGINIKRSEHVYMETDQIVFVGFMRTDSKLLDAGAVKYLRQITT